MWIYRKAIPSPLFPAAVFHSNEELTCSNGKSLKYPLPLLLLLIVLQTAG